MIGWRTKNRSFLENHIHSFCRESHNHVDECLFIAKANMDLYLRYPLRKPGLAGKAAEVKRVYKNSTDVYVLSQNEVPSERGTGIERHLAFGVKRVAGAAT